MHDKDILALALPAALALAADPLLGMVDTAFVGRLGADELVSNWLGAWRDMVKGAPRQCTNTSCV